MRIPVRTTVAILAAVLSGPSIASRLPAVQQFVLGNGITVLHRQTTDNEVTGFSFFLIGGISALDEATQGLEAFSLECALAGSELHPAPEWREIMDVTRASWTASYNYDWSRYHLTCLGEDLPILLEGFASCLLEPELAEASVERVRAKFLHDLSSTLGDPDRLVWLVTNRVFLEDHPYSLRPDGTVETIPALGVDHIEEYLDRRIKGGNILLVHVGPTPLSELARMLEDTFGAIPPGGGDAGGPPPIDPPGPGVVVEHREVPTSYAVCKFVGPDIGSADHPVLRVAMNVLSQRLTDVLRTGRGLTYAVYSGLTSYRRNWGYLYVSSPDPVRACSTMARVYTSMGVEPLDEEWVRGTVNEWRTLELLGDESRAAQCLKLGRAFLATGDWRTAYTCLDVAERVTAVDVRDVLSAYGSEPVWGLILDTTVTATCRLQAWPLLADSARVDAAPGP